jgi:hypothetical protein
LDIATTRLPETVRRAAFVLAAVACLAVAALAATPRTSADLPTPTGYNPNGLPTVGCFWTGPFTAGNPKTNIAYPGTHIAYWGAKFVTPPGAVLTLRGRFPHARYSSFNSYEEDGASASSLSDSQIRPDAGSINPSRPGKNRASRKRGYTIRVLGRARPQRPARNTLYGESIPGASQDILYRVYVPDRGRNLSGGTGLPKPRLRLADGTVLTGQALCEAMNSNHDYVPQTIPLPFYQSLVNSAGKDPATNPAEPRFEFSRFFNLPNVLARYGTEQAQQQAWQANPVEQGTQYNNNDARYMTGAYSFRFGEVLAIHGRMPTTPRTYGGRKRAVAGQLVEWDICTIQSLVTTRTYRCLFDQQVPMRNRKRGYVVLVSLKQDRPSNARRECGVAWLPADPAGDGAGRDDAGTLLNRNVLPDRGFRRSIWDVTSPFNAEEIMGRYYPRGTYMDTAGFESRGCPFRWR